MLKARISAEQLKEFVGTISALVDESKLSTVESGLTIKDVDHANVEMVEYKLGKADFNSEEAYKTVIW